MYSISYTFLLLTHKDSSVFNYFDIEKIKGISSLSVQFFLILKTITV